MKMPIHRQNPNTASQIHCSDKAIETFMKLDFHGKGKDKIIEICEYYEINYSFHGKEEYNNDNDSSTIIFLMNRGECIKYKYCS